MTNLVTCPRCGLDLIAEEYNDHNCSQKIKDVIKMGIQFWYDGGKDDNDDNVLIVKGVDGILYRLVQCDHQIPHNLSYQPTGNINKTTDKGTAPKNILFKTNHVNNKAWQEKG